MNMDCFLKRYTSFLMKDEGDSLFESFKFILGGTTSPRIGKLLNFAVSQMGHDECYVETGVFTGGTLIPASWNNGRVCIGIDPYEGMIESSDYLFIKEQAQRNMKTMSPNSKLIEKDFRNVTKEEIGMPIAVSFIDAMHNFNGVYDNLSWLHPLLADHAVIVFDDINFLEVSQAIAQWLKEHGETYDLTAYIKPFYKDENYISSISDRFLNNGICILRYHKDAIPLGIVAVP